MKSTATRDAPPGKTARTAARTEGLSAWRLILACQRTGSLVRACAQLGITVSSASRIMTAFEEENQLRLLDRSTRPARILPALERLLPVATAIVNAHAEAGRTLETLRRESRSRTVSGRFVRICLPVNVRNDRILDAILEYVEARPGLRVEFFADEGLKRLLSGAADIAQMGFDPAREEIHAEYVRTNCFPMLASRTFVQRHGLPEAIEALESLPVALRNPGNRSFSRRFERGGEETYFLPDGPNVIYADATTCRSLLVGGHAVSADVSIGAVLPELEAGMLTAVLDGWHRHPNDTYVCCHARNAGDPVIRDLMEIIRKTLREERRDRWEPWFRRLGIDPEGVKHSL